MRAWLDSLPSILVAADFKAVVEAILMAHAGQRGVLWGIGAHVLKTGLSPILIDLMQRGLVSALATNGAGLIHDFEIALVGSTSEDVDEALGPGRFGMAEETALQLNAAINEGVAAGEGIGQAVGRRLREMKPSHESLSVLAAAARLQIPVTVHIGIGTDIIHMHPIASGAALGEGSLRDFRYFVSNVARLGNGVYLNCGSAVVLPEVFLKAVAQPRHRARRPDDRQPRFHAALPSADQRRLTSREGHRQGLLDRGSSRVDDSAAGGGPARERLTDPPEQRLDVVCAKQHAGGDSPDRAAHVAARRTPGDGHRANTPDRIKA